METITLIEQGLKQEQNIKEFNKLLAPLQSKINLRLKDDPEARDEALKIMSSLRKSAFTYFISDRTK